MVEGIRRPAILLKQGSAPLALGDITPFLRASLRDALKVKYLVCGPNPNPPNFNLLAPSKQGGIE